MRRASTFLFKITNCKELLVIPLNALIAVVLCTAIFFAPASAAVPRPARPASPDVLVVGGTPAGVAAAIAAARRGANVTLVSEGSDLGGVLTGAMMDQWDLNTAPGGARVERGIFAEIYARLGDSFTPAAAATLFEQMAAGEPRIAVRYDERLAALAMAPQAGGKRIESVSFRDARTSEPFTVRAPIVIDATDFGDVASLAGAKYDLGRQDTGVDEGMQAVTEMFTIEGIDWDALADAYDASRDGNGGVVGRRAWGYDALMRTYTPRSRAVVVRDLNLGRLPDGTVTVNAIDVVGIDGRDPRQRAEARRLTELEAPRLIAFLRARLPGFARARVGSYAPEVYVRETRHIAGLESLTTADVWLGRVPVDSIGLASYPIDLHPVGAQDRPAFAPLRHVYGVPFGALVPSGLTNILIAGPAISASHLASGSARVIATTIEEGEAAGAASALAHHAGVDIATFARAAGYVATLRADLAINGALVGTPNAPARYVVAGALARRPSVCGGPKGLPRLACTPMSTSQGACAAITSIARPSGAPVYLPSRYAPRTMRCASVSLASSSTPAAT